MKYLKTYEKHLTPQIGDYVLTNIPLDTHDNDIINIRNFMNNTIGEVIDIIPNQNKPTYVVQYDKPPEYYIRNFNFKRTQHLNKIYKNYRYVYLSDILYFDNEPFDIDIIKDIKKYNL